MKEVVVNLELLEKRQKAGQAKKQQTSSNQISKGLDKLIAKEEKKPKKHIRIFDSGD